MSQPFEGDIRLKLRAIHLEGGDVLKTKIRNCGFMCLSALLSLAVCMGSSTQTATAQDYFVPVNPPPARYHLEGHVATEGSTITVQGKGEIEFKNTAKKPLTVVALDWQLDDRSLLEVTTSGETLELLNPQMGVPSRAPLYYRLSKPLKPRKKIRLEIDFKFSYQGKTDRIALQYWNPTLWWDDIPTQDFYRVKLDIPPEYSAAVSGRLNKSGYYSNDSVCTCFGIYLAKDMRMESREVKGVLITSLFTEDMEECAQVCLDTAVDVMQFYLDLHGFFPFDFLTIIPGADRPMGGYPWASGVVVIHGQQKFKERPLLHWQWITAHEIGHQYWGEYVMSNDTLSDYTDAWLMIGMGICADRFYTEARSLADDKHDSFINRYLEGVRNRYDTTADATESVRRRQKYDRNNVLIHGKGYSILSALRSVVGEEEFQKIYLASIRKFGGQRMGYRDLQTLAEEESGRNLQWFFEDWVRSSKYLCYQITSHKSFREGEGFITEVVAERVGDSMSMQVPLEARFVDGSSQKAVLARLQDKYKLRFESQAELKEVVLDPDGRLAMLDKPLAILPEDLPDKVNSLPYSGAPEKALELYRIAAESDLDIASLWFKLGMCVFEGGYFEEAFDSFKRLFELKSSKSYQFYAQVWMGNIRDAQGQREEALKHYRESLNFDTGSASRHDQYKIESSRKWVEERLREPYDWGRILKKQK